MSRMGIFLELNEKPEENLTQSGETLVQYKTIAEQVQNYPTPKKTSPMVEHARA